jgi:uncharacterized membrane protein
MKTGRLEAFSDGVLAIAITLLVLDLRVPDDPGRPLGTLLAEQWQSYLAYLVSFGVIGIMWVNHHALFRRVAKIDRALLFLNLGLLLFISVLPFPTAVAADGLRRGGQDAKTGMLAYGIAQVLVAIAFSAVWIYIVRKPGILRAPLTEPQRRVAIRRFTIGLAGYVVLCGVAFVSPIVALIGHGVIAGYYAFEQLPQVAEAPEPDQD